MGEVVVIQQKNQQMSVLQIQFTHEQEILAVFWGANKYCLTTAKQENETCVIDQINIKQIINFSFLPTAF